MTRRLLFGLAVAAVAALAVACGSGGSAPVTSPSTTATAATPASPSVSVDSFSGQWTPAGADSAAPALPDNTAVSLIADGVCSQVEFKVEKSDASTATIVFAATCANARIRGLGTGQMSGDVLHWKAEGTVSLATGRSCAFKFLEGNTATPVAPGQVKVTYHGRVCDIPVSGSQVLTRE
jgi:hypothetical protein